LGASASCSPPGSDIPAQLARPGTPPLRGAELPAEQFDAREVARAIPASEYLELPGARSSAIVHIAGIESWLRTTPVTDPELVIGPVLDFFGRIDTGS
jgi:hypothetical protein